MALRCGKSMMLVATFTALAAVLAWAWRDGGERPLTWHSVPVELPGAGQ